MYFRSYDSVIHRGQAGPCCSFGISTWVHVVGTISTTQVNFYMNGALGSTGGLSSPVPVKTRTGHWIGRSHWNDGRLSGVFAYLRIWHGATLSASDVPRLYSSRLTP